MSETPLKQAPVKAGAYKILGISLHPVTETELLDYIDERCQRGEQAVIPTLNIYGANFAVQFPWYKEFFNQSQLVYCDGDGVRWGLALLGFKPPAKISLSRWIWTLAEFAEKKGLSFYFLGGRKGVPEKAAENLRQRFPQLKIVGTQDNDFQKEGPENEKVIETINRLKPNIIIIGLGMPLQEQWIVKHGRKMHTNIFMTAGSTTEFVSGNIKSPPDWMVRMQLEWFFRLTQEPKRLFKRYVIGNPLFLFRVLQEKLGIRKF